MQESAAAELLGQMKNKFNESLPVLPTMDSSPEKDKAGAEIDSDSKLNTDRVVKRTRLRSHSKSILQSAIARKERSFGLYEKSKTISRKNLVKNKANEEDKSSKKAPKRTRKKASESVSPSTNNESKGDVQKQETGETLSHIEKRLCKCLENKQLYMQSECDTQFCTAVDEVSGKLSGCCREVDVRAVSMVRPSSRIPFSVYCQSHLQRLIKHNCCPTCGLFCTQGNFLECTLGHHFHKDCKLTIDGKDYCPHCGAGSATSSHVTITMHSAKEPMFLPEQRSHHSVAKMRFGEATVASPSVPQLPQSDTSDRCDEEALITAVEKDEPERVAAILASGNVDATARLHGYRSGTFLHLATLKRSLELVHLFVTCQVDIDQLDSDQNSALALAISAHQNDIARYLIQAGASIFLKGMDGMTPLHTAAKSGNLALCELIVERGHDVRQLVNFQDDGGWTPLVWACEHGHRDVVQFLVSRGADIHVRDVELNVALHWAAFKGSTDILTLLLDLHSDVNVANVHGDTPLHISAREDHYDCVIVLLSRRADVRAVNRNDETPLECAPEDGRCFGPLSVNAELARTVHAPTSRLLTNDISKGREPNPIQCVNAVDADSEPHQYKYVRRNCVTSDNVRINANIADLQCCSCEDRCRGPSCACATASWYDSQGKLVPEFDFDAAAPLIFECNDLCACNAILCANRLVQKPTVQRFELFKTPSKGWGVRTLDFIDRGSYVCEYVGEILTDTEAERRKDDSYLFDLDNRETDSFCIDAKFYGNFTRFINHSCDPNLHPLKVFVEHRDVRFPRIAFFAKRDIKVNEELSFDYGDKFWLIKYKSFFCECDTESCRYSKDTMGFTLEKYKLLRN